MTNPSFQLVKFFSLYANNPTEARIKSKRVFAIEMPNAKSRESKSHLSEPPKKYLLTSSANSPQVSVTNHNIGHSINNNINSFKGKKVIKITPTSILNNSRICGIPNMPTMPTMPNPANHKSSPIFSISLPPKPKNNIIIPNRAIAPNANNSKPTFLIPQTKHQIVTKKPIAKTVTVSSIDNAAIDDVYNAQYFDYAPHQTATTATTHHQFNNSTLSNNNRTNRNYNNNTNINNHNNYFNLDDFLNSPQKKERHDSSDENGAAYDHESDLLFSGDQHNSHDVSDMISYCFSIVAHCRAR